MKISNQNDTFIAFDKPHTSNKKTYIKKIMIRLKNSFFCLKTKIIEKKVKEVCEENSWKTEDINLKHIDYHFLKAISIFSFSLFPSINEISNQFCF